MKKRLLISFVLLASLCTALVNQNVTIATPVKKIVHIDLGVPSGENGFNLQGWAFTQGPPDNQLASPSGDLTKRYQRLRSDNSLTFVDLKKNHSYLLTTEVEDGGCTDNFKLLANGVELYSFTAGPSTVPIVRIHSIEIPSTVVSSDSLVVTFRNTSTDNCGLAAVYNVTLQPKNSTDNTGQAFHAPYPPNEEWELTWGTDPMHVPWSMDQGGVAHDYAPVGVVCKDANGTVLVDIDRTHHVTAMATGIVVRVNHAGAWMAIDHGKGLVGFYLHVGEIAVSEGQKVNPASVLGFPSVLGGIRADTCHVHVAFATYETPPEIGAWDPNTVTWATFFPSLKAS